MIDTSDLKQLLAGILLTDGEASALVIALACYALAPSQRIVGVLLCAVAGAAATMAGTLGVMALIAIPWPFATSAVVLLAIAMIVPIRPRTQPHAHGLDLVRAAAISVAGIFVLQFPNMPAIAVITIDRLWVLPIMLAVTFGYAIFAALGLALTRLAAAPVLIFIALAALAATATSAFFQEPAFWGGTLAGLPVGTAGMIAVPIVAFGVAGTRFLLARRGAPTPGVEPRGTHRGGAVISRRARSAAVYAGATMALPLGTGASTVDLFLTATAWVVLIGAVTTYAIALPIEQRRRNGALAAIYRDQTLHVDSTTTVYLYLRSFDVGKSSLLGRLVSHVFLSGQNFASYFVGARYDLEEELADALDTGILLAIGDKRISYGAAKLTTGDGWQDDFLALARRADRIVLIPGISPGTLWEIGQVLNTPELQQKTDWAMLAQTGKRRWNAIARECEARCGLRLPAYRRDGCAFALAPDHSATAITSLQAFVDRARPPVTAAALS